MPENMIAGALSGHPVHLNAWPPRSANRSASDARQSVRLVYRPVLATIPQPTVKFVRELVCENSIACERLLWTQAFRSTEEAEQHYQWMME